STASLACRIYFHKVGALSGQGQHYYRWLSMRDLIIPNSIGNFVQLVGLEPENWLAVGGDNSRTHIYRDPHSITYTKAERADASPAATAGFQQALANPQLIGILCQQHIGSFQDMDRWDATFTMKSFAVCEPFASSAKQENAACAPPSPQE